MKTKTLIFLIVASILLIGCASQNTELSFSSEKIIVVGSGKSNPKPDVVDIPGEDVIGFFRTQAELGLQQNVRKHHLNQQYG